MPPENHTRNPFSTFAFSPLGVTFETQEAGEEIILLLRQHVITQVPYILITIFLLFVPFLLAPIFALLRVDIFSLLTPLQVFLITIFWYLFVLAYVLYRFVFWYYNVYILTNERIIDFDFKGILHKEASYAKLTQIEDVSPKSVGFFSTFFHYGDVYIQTAGEMREFEFLRVPKPDDVAQRILAEVRVEEGEAPGVIQ